MSCLTCHGAPYRAPPGCHEQYVHYFTLEGSAACALGRLASSPRHSHPSGCVAAPSVRVSSAERSRVGGLTHTRILLLERR